MQIGRLPESRTAKIAALAAAVIGVLVGLYQAYLWLSPIMTGRGVLQMF